MDAAQQKAIEDEVRKKNPGTEIWTGSHAKTGDWWLYRGAAKHEARIYTKTLRAEQEKGEAGDKEVAFRVLIDSCVLWPPKQKDIDAGSWSAELIAQLGDPPMTIERLLSQRPMIPAVLAGDVCVASGFTDETNQKKL